MATGGCVAGAANHDVAQVLVAGLSPLGCGSGSVCVWGGDELSRALDPSGQHKARTRLTIHFWRFGTDDDWRHVIEQARKEAQVATSP